MSLRTATCYHSLYGLTGGSQASAAPEVQDFSEILYSNNERCRIHKADFSIRDRR
jgi:hypothetical protein